MGKSSPSPQAQTQPASASETKLSEESAKLLQGTEPLRNLVQNYAQLGLTTGSAPNIAIPEIQKAIEQVLGATSTSRQQTQDQLVTAGLDRTPYGANILANLGLSGNLAAANVPTQMNQNIINRGLTSAGVGTQVGIQGLSSAAGDATARENAGLASSTQIQNTNTNATAQMISSMMGMFSFKF